MNRDSVSTLHESNVLEDASHLRSVALTLIELNDSVADIVVVLVDKEELLAVSIVDKVVDRGLLEIEHGGVSSVVKRHGALGSELTEVLTILLQTSPEDDSDGVDAAAAGARAVDSEGDGLGLGVGLRELEGVLADLVAGKSAGLLGLVVNVKGDVDGTALVEIVVVDGVLDLVKVGEGLELGALVGLRDDLVGVELDNITAVLGDVDHHTGSVSDHVVSKSRAGDTSKNSNNKLVHLSICKRA